MKRILGMLLIILTLLIVMASSSFAAKLYTTTIHETTVEEVQDMILEVMTGKNFTVDEVDKYKIIVAKNFGDGFWVTSQLCKVKFNMLERDGNIKLMVSETELVQGQLARQRSIDHLIPLIKEIRNKIDGTPMDQIASEAVNQLPGSGNERQKALGIILGDKNGEGYILIAKVEPGSLAADEGLLPKDIIIEVNVCITKEMESSALKSYLANKFAANASIMLFYNRNDTTEMVILKQQM